MFTKCIWKKLKQAVPVFLFRLDLFSSYLSTTLLYPSLNPTAFSNKTYSITFDTLCSLKCRTPFLTITTEVLSFEDKYILLEMGEGRRFKPRASKIFLNPQIFHFHHLHCLSSHYSLGAI